MNREEFAVARQALIEGDRRTWKSVVADFDSSFRRMMTFNFCGKERDEIFNEALEVFYGNLEKEDFTISSSTTAYLIGVAKLICMASRRGQKSNVSKPGSVDFDELAEGFLSGSELIDQDKERRKGMIKLIKGGLEQLGENCRQMMWMRYYEDPPVPFKLIAEILGYGSDQVSRSRLEDCKRRLRKYIRPTYQKLIE